MSDVTKLKAAFEATLLDRNELLAHYQRVTADNLRLKKRLEKCEAALGQLASISSEDCSCLPAFKERNLIDPSCSYHDYKWAIDAARAALEEK